MDHVLKFNVRMQLGLTTKIWAEQTWQTRSADFIHALTNHHVNGILVFG